MSFRPRTLLIPGLLGSLALASSLRASEIVTDTAPPAPRVEHPPPSRDGYVWAPGHWEWNRHSYVWVSGTWIIERRASHWVADRWEQSGSQWHFIAGHWEHQS